MEATMSNETMSAQDLCKELVRTVNQRMDEGVAPLTVATAGFMFAATVYLSLAKESRLSLQHFLEGAGLAFEQGLASKQLEQRVTSAKPEGVN